MTIAGKLLHQRNTRKNELKKETVANNPFLQTQTWGKNTFNVKDINPFHASDLFFYCLKTLEDLWFSDVYRGYRKRPVA